MYTAIFDELGLSKNEGKIYEILLTHGELAVGSISEKTLIHRRNVYDTLNRLGEKGLVFEKLGNKESIYQAVDPEKLMDILSEKEDKLWLALPSLKKLYTSNPDEDRVVLYSGIESWKSYFRDIINVGEDLRLIGAAGASLNPKLGSAFEQFKREVKRKNIKIKTLYRPDVLKTEGIVGHLGETSENRILTNEHNYTFPASCSIYGNHVVIFSPIGTVGNLPENITGTFIVNTGIAETFRNWFDLAWEASVEK